MLLNTKPRFVGDVLTVRVTGEDIVEVATAAKLIGATVYITRGGRSWFRCAFDQLPAVRENHAVCEVNLTGWLWWARPKEYSPADIGGAFSVDLPDQSESVQPDAGTVPPE